MKKPATLRTTHLFIPSGRFKVSAIGRRLEYCDYPGCGKVRLGLSHAPIGKRSKLVKQGVAGYVSRPNEQRENDGPAAPEAPRPEPEAPPAEPWQLGMLKDALAHVLELPDIGWRLRLRILDVTKALELGIEDPPLQRDPVLEEPALLPALPRPEPSTRPSQRHVNRKLIRSLKDNWRDLAERALDQGWTVDKQGGHLKFQHAGSDATIVIPSSPGEGRGYLNARATFKRKGLNVEGL